MLLGQGRTLGMVLTSRNTLVDFVHHFQIIYLDIQKKPCKTPHNKCLNLALTICYVFFFEFERLSKDVYNLFVIGEKPFKCEQCDLSFRQYSDLMYHTASKHDEKKAFQARKPLHSCIYF